MAQNDKKILSVSFCISGTVHHEDTIILHMCTINVNHMMYGSWEMEHDTEFLSFWTIFCTFTPLKTKKNQNLEKLKKKPRDTIILHKCTKSWSYAILFLRYGAWRMYLLFFILGYFLPFYSHNSPKNQNFKTMKNAPGDIIILHKCTKNYNHMTYCSWDMVCDRCNCYLIFWAIFWPFSLITAWKIKISKKWKKENPGDVIILHKCTKNFDHMVYCSWDIMHDRCNCYFSFWAIFCPFSPMTDQKSKFQKKGKKSWRCHHFTQVY